MRLLNPLFRIVFITFLMSLLACTHNPEKIITENKNGIAVANLKANIETTPVQSTDDAADDPAIWINLASAKDSRVLGTDKQRGLMVYNLDGELVQSLAVGRVNNVDIRTEVFGYDIAVASNRSDNSLTLFSISKSGNVSHIGSQSLSMPEPYGTCMYKDINDKTFVFVNDKSGDYEQWQINGIAPLQLELVRSFKLPSQPEGCVAHDKSGQLFLGEEAVGVWKLDLNSPISQAELITSTKDGVLVADVEGMDIYLGEQTDYLLVSSQGDNSYAIYEIGHDATAFDYLGSFRVVADKAKGIDGTQETDGLTISSADFGGAFSKGFIAIQDGFNRLPKDTQNFKYLSWETVISALLVPPQKQ